MQNENEACYLIGAAIRVPKLRELAMSGLGTLPLFDEIKFPVQSMIWETIQRMYSIGNGMTVSSIMCEIRSRNSGSSDESAVNDAVAMVEAVGKINEDDIDVDYARNVLIAFMTEARKADSVRRILAAGDVFQLTSAIEDTTKELSRMTITDETDISMPLMDPERYMPKTEKIPTGVNWIDYLSGGGHTKGELIGVLGPQGGGKTMTATSMLIAQAKREQHCLLISYEQSVVGDVAMRLFTRMFDDANGDLLRGYRDPFPDPLKNTRVDMNFFRSHTFSQWPKVVTDRFYELRDMFGKYVHSLDMSQDVDMKSTKPQGIRGVPDIEDAVEQMKSKGMPITYLIIDWLWPAVTRWFYNGGSRKFRSELECATQFLYQLKQLTERQQLIVFLFHQLDNDTTRASPSLQPKVTNSLNIRSFSQVMQHCYVIGNRDKQSNVMWLGNDKARTGVPQYILGQMDGALGVIDRTDGYELSRGRFVPIGQTVSEDDEKPRPGASMYL